MRNVEIEIEALLFVAAEPVNLKRLSEILELDEAEVRTNIDNLSAHLTGGLRISMHNDTYQLTTNPKVAAVVGKFLLEEAKTDLSKPALETLAIIAYRGPVTRSEIETVRGVNSEVMLKNLLQRDLISEHGRTNAPGKSVQYSVSHTFLRHFGLKATSELPPLEEQL